MNSNQDQCAVARRCIVAIAAGNQPEVSNAQQRGLAEHLVDCQPCRELYHQESQLTRLLISASTKTNAINTSPALQPASQPAPRPRQSNPMSAGVWKWAAALAAMILVFSSIVVLQNRPQRNLHVHQPTKSMDSDSASSLGLIETRPIITNAAYISSTRELQQNDNRVELPAGASGNIELTGAGTIHAFGPVVLEIDQVDGIWKTTVLSGTLRITVNKDQKIKVSGHNGSEELDAGIYQVNSEGTFVEKINPWRSAVEEAYIAAIIEHVKSIPVGGNQLDQEEKQQETPPTQEEAEAMKTFFDDAMSTFRAGQHKKHDMKTTAELLLKVIEHPHANTTQKNGARFYRCAALANSQQYQAALDIGNQMVAENPDQPDVILHIIADSHFHLGQVEKAQELWKQLLEKHPDTPYKTMIQLRLGESPEGGQDFSNRRTTIPPTSVLPYVSNSKADQFVEGQKDGYLVVACGLDEDNADHQKFLAVAHQVEQFHKASLFEFDGKDFKKLKKTIARNKPANVLFVIPPQKLDVDFHRQVFLMAPTLDNDLFADFAWGYLTARDGEAAEKFWQRIENLHQNGLANQNWVETQVIGGNQKSYVTEGANSIPEGAATAGFQGRRLSFSQVTVDPDVLEFVDRELPSLNRASVIAMTGNGDPQSIWLFDDSRNSDPSRHWQFDPKKVGHDPNNEMTRIKAKHFRSLDLQSPIVWSGTCHSGACQRVYVEGDIVSTFGTSDKTEAYDLDPNDSIALALLDAGAGSLLVPIASNHGMSCSMEARFCFQHGATLGETLKSTYDDVLFQARGIPKLVIVSQESEEDQKVPSFYREPAMQSAGANRILIGDPALRLFQQTEVPSESTSIAFDKKKRTARAELEWKKGFHPWAWNIFADGGGMGRRIQARVDVPAEVATKAKRLAIKGTLTNESGETIKANFRVEVEQVRGKTYWHLQADTNAQELMHEYHQATIDLTWK